MYIRTNIIWTVEYSFWKWLQFFLTSSKISKIYMEMEQQWNAQIFVCWVGQKPTAGWNQAPNGMKMTADLASGLLDQDILQDHYIIANNFNGK